MANASNYLENRIIDALFRGMAYTWPTTVYIALFTSDPTDANTGTEVTGGNYARASVLSQYNNFKSTQGTTANEASTGTGGATTNAIMIQYPTPSANWGLVTHFGVYDALTGGNLLVHGALSTPRNIVSGTGGPSFAVDALEIKVA